MMAGPGDGVDGPDPDGRRVETIRDRLDEERSSYLDEYPAEREPDGDVMLPHHFYIGVLTALFGFMFVWPAYPVTGASMVVVGTFVMIDDVVSHVFGVRTPLDHAWGAIRKYVR